MTNEIADTILQVMGWTLFAVPTILFFVTREDWKSRIFLTPLAGAVFFAASWIFSTIFVLVLVAPFI